MANRGIWVIPSEENASHDVTIHGVLEKGISVLHHGRNPPVPLEGLSLSPQDPPSWNSFMAPDGRPVFPSGVGCECYMVGNCAGVQ